MPQQELVTPQTVESEVIIETRELSRVYPGVVALDNVSYRVYRNKVNVLIGENGAGKSTMMKMLAGVETPSSGQIILEGTPVSLSSTHQAERKGISIIFQELNLFPNMNIMDNIFMANEFFQKGKINEKYQYELAKKTTGKTGAQCRSLYTTWRIRYRPPAVGRNCTCTVERHSRINHG